MNAGVRIKSGREGSEDILQISIFVLLSRDPRQDAGVLLIVLRLYYHVLNLRQLRKLTISWDIQENVFE